MAPWRCRCMRCCASRVLRTRRALLGHPADAPRRVAARRSADVIKLAADLIGRSLEARTFHLIKTVCARRSCTIPLVVPNCGHHTCIASTLR
eukprot:6008214-Prymnesium_polylepis.1